MNAKTEEAIELSNAAARLLSANSGVHSNKANELADALTSKALSLLTGDRAGRVRDVRDGNITIGGIEIGYCDDGSIFLVADGEGGSFHKDEFEACIRQFIKDRI